MHFISNNLNTFNIYQMYIIRLRNKFCIYLSKYGIAIVSGLKVTRCQSARVESTPPEHRKHTFEGLKMHCVFKTGFLDVAGDFPARGTGLVFTALPAWCLTGRQ